MTENAFNILAKAAKKWPEKVAVYDANGKITFKELYLKSLTLSDELQGYGITKGQGLGVIARNSSEFIIALFAGLASGATVLPLSHQLRRYEIDSIVNESGLHAIVDDGSAPLEEKRPTLQSLEPFRFSRTLNSIEHPIATHVTDPAFIRFTSGTTGKAKGVVISHKSVHERVQGAERALGLQQDDVVIWVLPIAYHFIASIVLYIHCGATLVIAENFMAPVVLANIRKYKGTLLYASPMHLRLLASDNSGQMMNSMKLVVSTSTAISKSICENFYKRYNIPVSQAYGIIEIGLPIINRRSSLDYPESVGEAVEGYEIALLNEEGEVSKDREGLLAIKGPGMFDAYLNPPLKRDEVLKSGYFPTADFATMDSNGLIFIKGRKSSVINISGNKVFPEEVEDLINTLPQVKASRISGIPHPIMGQIVQAEVVLSPDHHIDAEALISFCRKNLSSFKIPQRVKFVDSLKMTGSGKIQRH